MHGYDDHWLEDPKRDKPLGHRWRMPHLELIEALRLPPMKSKTQSDVRDLCLADIIMSERMYPGRRISYSRSDQFYKNRRQYTPEGYNLANVTAAIDLLDTLGYIVEHNKRPPGCRGTQSSFLPNPSLAMLLLPAVHEPVRNEIIMKDAEGNVVPYADTDKGQVKQNADGRNRKGPAFSGRVHDMRQVVRKVNEVLENTDIVLDAEGVVADGPWLRKGDYVMYPALKSLYRVFNGGWKLGGRFYGGWWQGVKSEDRKFFLLDGERTEEVDYSQIHPRIIYAEAGFELVGDAYDIPGYDRDICKTAFNILVNAACYLSALGALTRDMNGDRKGAEALIAAIKARHADVAKYFHSSAGVRLQGKDSRMAEIVLTEMTVKRGIPVLPVHDSFIVPESHKETLVQAMKAAYERVVGKTVYRDRIVKLRVGNTPVKTSAYTGTDYKRTVRSGAQRPSSPLAPTFIMETVPVDPGPSSVLPAVDSVDHSLPAADSMFPKPVVPVLPPKPVICRPAPEFLRRARDQRLKEWEVEQAAKEAKRIARFRQRGAYSIENDPEGISAHSDQELVLYADARRS